MPVTGCKQSLPHPQLPQIDLISESLFSSPSQPRNKLSHVGKYPGWVVFCECVLGWGVERYEGRRGEGEGWSGQTVCGPSIVSQCAVQMCSLLAVEARLETVVELLM